VFAQSLRAADLLEQRHAEMLFQAGHLLRDRGLRAVHLLGGEREAFPVGNRDKRAEKLQLEGAHNS
jgi:hypothetical protein